MRGFHRFLVGAVKIVEVFDANYSHFSLPQFSKSLFVSLFDQAMDCKVSLSSVEVAGGFCT